MSEFLRERAQEIFEHFILTCASSAPTRSATDRFADQMKADDRAPRNMIIFAVIHFITAVCGAAIVTDEGSLVR